MEYAEALPANCPPDAAADIELKSVFRVVRKLQPVREDFLSHATLGRQKLPDMDDCRFASCSLFSCKDKARNLAKRLPKTQCETPHISELKVAAGSGRSLGFRLVQSQKAMAAARDRAERKFLASLS